MNQERCELTDLPVTMCACDAHRSVKMNVLYVEHRDRGRRTSITFHDAGCYHYERRAIRSALDEYDLQAGEIREASADLWLRGWMPLLEAQQILTTDPSAKVCHHCRPWVPYEPGSRGVKVRQPKPPR